MDIGPLLGLWFQTLVVGLTMNIQTGSIMVVVGICGAENQDGGGDISGAIWGYYTVLLLLLPVQDGKHQKAGR